MDVEMYDISEDSDISDISMEDVEIIRPLIGYLRMKFSDRDNFIAAEPHTWERIEMFIVQ